MELATADGTLLVQELGEDRRRLVARPADPAAFLACEAWETAYPPDLVEALLDKKGLAWVCDEIRRDEDPGYVRAEVELLLDAYLPDAPAGLRVLDFGCGSGASTIALGRLLEDVEVVGVELDPELVALAGRRLAHHGLGHVRVLASPAPDALPDGLGQFDVVCLSAVVEHLLPGERRRLLPLLWGALRPGGVLLVSETPHRWSPVEPHTTHLPLVNLLPRPLAFAAARRSPRVPGHWTWDDLLRAGLRGSSVGELLRRLGSEGGAPRLRAPRGRGFRDPVDVWYAAGRPSRRRRGVVAVLRAANRIAGRTFTPWLYVAIEKGGR